MQVKVTYTPENKWGTIGKLDDLIVKALKEVGLEWYAQGLDITTGERDICFDWKE